METVVDHQLFGKVVAQVRVIEFQKKGLPHSHCIFILDRTAKNNLRSPEAVDEALCAEIPSEDEPELRALALQHMIHNPCGAHNPASVCMGEKGCKKKFPKQFFASTMQGVT